MILPLLLIAAQAAPAPSAPPTVFFTAAQAYGECLKQGGAAAPASVTPEAAAQQVVAGCAAQRAALDSQFDAWISATGMPADSRDAARAQYTARMSGVPAQVAENIRAARARAAPTPTPTPTPTPGK